MQAKSARINIDDAKLLEQCRKGDSEAMQRLILRYQNRIYNVILKICANPDDAAELTQETFVKVIENLERFEGRSGFYTWAFRIAVNLTLTYCKRSMKLGLRSLDCEIDAGNGQAKQQLKDIIADTSVPDPAKVAQNEELCKIVIRTMMKLDDDHRAVIVLRDIEGMNYAQMADVLEIELGTVKSRLCRARNNLRDILAEVIK